MQACFEVYVTIALFSNMEAPTVPERTPKRFANRFRGLTRNAYMVKHGVTQGYLGPQYTQAGTNSHLGWTFTNLLWILSLGTVSCTSTGPRLTCCLLVPKTCRAELESLLTIGSLPCAWALTGSRNLGFQ